MSRYGWKPYVPVAAHRARARKKMATLRKNGQDIKPVRLEGRKIARTFWGAAWCDHLESFSDYQNRLPRGRTYVRNGLVCHLDIVKGAVTAIVSGSRLYNVNISIKTLSSKKWKALKKRCAGQIGSLLELLKGRLSENVMSVVTDRNSGLFPLPGEIRLQCSCPDWAVMCKHVAAALYGVGARLDEQPELLFLLRGVDHEELIGAEVGVAAGGDAKGGRKRIADEELADVFGIELADEWVSSGEAKPARRQKTGSKWPTSSKCAAKPTAKGDVETGPNTAQIPKTPERARKSLRGASRTGPITGRAVVGLRTKFGMSQSEFARLLGVSTPCIGNWERKSGALNLQARTLDAWMRATELTKRQAWQRLGRS